MRTIQKERVVTYEMFVANDGTELTSREECVKYDESAYGVLNEKYQKLVKGTCTEEEFFGFGSCDNTVEFLKVKTQDDKDLVMQMFFFINPHMQCLESDCYRSQVEKNEKLLQRAIDEDDILMIGRGYAEKEIFWFLDTRNSMKEEVDRICEVSTKKNEE